MPERDSNVSALREVDTSTRRGLGDIVLGSDDPYADLPFPSTPRYGALVDSKDDWPDSYSSDMLVELGWQGSD